MFKKGDMVTRLVDGNGVTIGKSYLVCKDRTDDRVSLINDNGVESIGDSINFVLDKNYVVHNILKEL